MLLFFGAGVLAVVSAIVSLFFALGRRPPRAWATEMPDVNSREFLVGISAIVNSPLQAGGTVLLLNNGDEFFPAMLSRHAGGPAHDQLHRLHLGARQGERPVLRRS